MNPCELGYRSSPDNVEDYLARCDELARRFDIKGMNKKVQKMLTEQK